MLKVLPRLSTKRLQIIHLGDASPLEVLNYFTRNKDHLAPTDPPHPEGFFTTDFWEVKIQSARKEQDDESSVRWVLKDKNLPSNILGTANLTQIFRGPFQACYLGFGIAKDSEGKGLMFEALVEIIRYAFEDLHLHRIMANHSVENMRSANVLQKLGFQKEGIGKEYLLINGSWRDHVLNSLINPNW